MGKLKKIGIGIGVLVGGFFVFVLALGYGLDNSQGFKILELSSLSDEEIISQAVDFEFDDIVRNVDMYRGKVIIFDGTVQEAHNLSGDDYELRMNNGEDNFMEYFLVKYTGKRLLMGDYARVYGVVDSIAELEMPLGGTIPMPVVIALRMWYS